MPKSTTNDAIERIEDDIIEAIAQLGSNDDLPENIKTMLKVREYLLDMQVSDAPAAEPKPRKPRKKRGQPPADVSAEALKF